MPIRTAGQNLSAPIAAAIGNARNGLGSPLESMHVNVGSFRLPRTQLMEDFSPFPGAVATGVGGGWETIAAGATVDNDNAGVFPGNGVVLLNAAAVATDHIQLTTELGVTNAGSGKRIICATRVLLDVIDETDFKLGFATPGGNWVTFAGITDRIFGVIQGLNAGNLVALATERASGGVTTTAATATIRDEILAAAGSGLQLAVNVASNNTCTLLYSLDDGDTWKAAATLDGADASIPNTATLSTGIDMSGTTTPANAYVDWISYSKDL